MFTGIIDHCGVITQIEHLPNASRVWIQTKFSDLELGESIAVDGVCLTVADIKTNTFACDVSPETLNVTTAKYFKLSKSVNIERALQLSSRLGGHMVAGHVDQIGKVKAISKQGEFTEIVFFEVQAVNMPMVTKKGSIAINGVSLTINEVFEDGFSVMLIPHTLERTNLSELNDKNDVNLEFDMMARIIVDQCARYFKGDNVLLSSEWGG